MRQFRTIKLRELISLSRLEQSSTLRWSRIYTTQVFSQTQLAKRTRITLLELLTLLLKNYIHCLTSLKMAEASYLKIELIWTWSPSKKRRIRTETANNTCKIWLSHHQIVLRRANQYNLHKINVPKRKNGKLWLSQRIYKGTALSYMKVKGVDTYQTTKVI